MSAPQNEEVKWYYLDRERHTNGPYTREALVDLIHGGTLDSRNYIWNGESISKWERIEKVTDQLVAIGVDPSKMKVRSKARKSSRGGAETKKKQQQPQKQVNQVLLDEIPNTTTIRISKKEEETIQPQLQIQQQQQRVEKQQQPTYQQIVEAGASEPAASHSSRDEMPSGSHSMNPAPYQSSDPRVAYHQQNLQQYSSNGLEEVEAGGNRGRALENHQQQQQLQQQQQNEIITATTATPSLHPKAEVISTTHQSSYNNNNIRTMEKPVASSHIVDEREQNKNKVREVVPKTESQLVELNETRQPVVETPQPKKKEVAQPVRQKKLKSIEKIEYEGVALIIESCVTYGTVDGEITFNREASEATFDMKFVKVHEIAPDTHAVALNFDWNQETGEIIEKGRQWTGTCVSVGNAFHIKSLDGIDICMLPAGFEPVPRGIQTKQYQYLGLALGVDQAIYWGTYSGTVVFNVPERIITFHIDFDSAYPDSIENHRETLEFIWNPDEGLVDDQSHHFFGRCCGVGNCFHLRNSYEMDIIFLPQITPQTEEEIQQEMMEAQVLTNTPVGSEQPTRNNEHENFETEAQMMQPAETQIEPALEPEIYPVETEAEKDEREMYNLQDQIDDKGMVENILGDQVKKLQSQLKEVQKNREENVRQKEEEIQRLKVEWEEKLQNEAETIRQQVVQQSERKFTAQLEESKTEMDSLKDRLANLERHIQSTKNEREKMEESLNEKLRENNMMRQSFHTDLESLKQELKRRDHEIEKLREENYRLSQSRESTPTGDRFEGPPEIKSFSNRIDLRPKSSQLPTKNQTRQNVPLGFGGKQDNPRRIIRRKQVTGSSEPARSYCSQSPDSSRRLDNSASKPLSLKKDRKRETDLIYKMAMKIKRSKSADRGNSIPTYPTSETNDADQQAPATPTFPPTLGIFE